MKIRHGLAPLGAALFLALSSAPTHALASYHSWRAVQFGVNAGDPAIAGDTADPDADTLPNLVEYALGTRPDAPDLAPAVAASDSGLSLSFTHDTIASGVTLIVQAADDLGGAWTDLASGANGASLVALVPDVLIQENGSDTKTVVVADQRTPSAGARFLRLKAVKAPTQTVAALLQGQSNAVDMMQNAAWFGGDAGYKSIFKGLVKDLTGIPNVDVYGTTWETGKRTAVGGTWLYKSGLATGVWLSANEDDPATWPLAEIGLECDNYIRTYIRGTLGDAPLAFLRVHSEYDGRHTTEAVHYAAANRNFVARMRDAADLPAHRMPVLYGQIPYAAGAALGLDALRAAWAGDVAEPAMHARYAWGAINDGPYYTDNVHIGIEACRQAHARMAFAYARWLHDHGYANTDLSSLPLTGPRIVSFRRGPAANQIDVTIRHDTGTDIVIPANVNLAAFAITDPLSNPPPAATAAQRIDATTLRLTLDKNLSASAAIKLDHLGYATAPLSNRNLMYGTGSLITDNYHLLAKPAHVAQALATHYSPTSVPAAPAAFTLPLARMVGALVIEP